MTSYFRGSHGCFLVYDVTDLESFKQITQWMETVTKLEPTTVKFLIGNKIDLQQQRQVTTEMGEQFATENSLKFIETSAKNNTNIDLMFEMIADLCLKDVIPSSTPEDQVNLGKPQQEDESKCC